MNDRLLSLLGLMRRAGKISMGFDAAAEAMSSGEAILLLLSEELSERTSGAIRKIAEQSGTCVITCKCGMDELGHAIGRRSTGIIAVNDSGFADKIKTLCAENSQEECI
ncbi:MAG: ribosomal L7Ae/L30e/S12e/Gadd45 family protein [Clostridia bacterium]|nr:ribosomal L7Ae/L30e/S12e/Gadd45 family protein [Clostridia bacterium]